MRALLAAALALALAVSAASAHVHVAAQGSEECAACVVRGGGDVARSQTPDVSRVDLPAGRAPLPPAAFPVTGAPLGAVPGQSPPGA